jgi:MBG domain (YGX type)
LIGTLSGFLTADGVTATYSRTPGETVAGSPYTISATLSPAGVLGNYTITYNTANFTITPAGLTITATNRSKVFGATYTPDTTPPSVDFTISGTLYFGDTITSITLNSTGYPSSALPGSYIVTPSAAVFVPAGAAANYNITYTPGTFSVGYGTCTGQNPGGVILQPINANGSSVFKVGSTVPVKFTVCDANGNPISDPMVVFGNSTGSITLISAVRGTVDNVNESMDNDIPDVAFRYSSGIWIFNMATNNLQKNTTYTYIINLKVGTITFTFGTK